MSRDLFDSLLIGVSIGFIALAIHALTDGSAPQYQLLALTLAGAALFAIHLTMALRRRRQSQAQKETAEQAQAPEMYLRDRRNPFFRELTRDWTGLDEYPGAAEPPGKGADTVRQETQPPPEQGAEDGR